MTAVWALVQNFTCCDTKVHPTDDRSMLIERPFHITPAQEVDIIGDQTGIASPDNNVALFALIRSVQWCDRTDPTRNIADQSGRPARAYVHFDTQTTAINASEGIFNTVAGDGVSCIVHALGANARLRRGHFCRLRYG